MQIKQGRNGTNRKMATILSILDFQFSFELMSAKQMGLTLLRNSLHTCNCPFGSGIHSSLRTPENSRVYNNGTDVGNFRAKEPGSKRGMK